MLFYPTALSEQISYLISSLNIAPTVGVSIFSIGSWVEGSFNINWGEVFGLSAVLGTLYNDGKKVSNQTIQGFIDLQVGGIYKLSLSKVIDKICKHEMGSIFYQIICENGNIPTLYIPFLRLSKIVETSERIKCTLAFFKHKKNIFSILNYGIDAIYKKTFTLNFSILTILQLTKKWKEIIDSLNLQITLSAFKRSFTIISSLASVLKYFEFSRLDSLLNIPTIALLFPKVFNQDSFFNLSSTVTFNLNEKNQLKLAINIFIGFCYICVTIVNNTICISLMLYGNKTFEREKELIHLESLKKDQIKTKDINFRGKEVEYNA